MAEGGAALNSDGRPLTGLLRWDRPVDRAHVDALLAAHPDLAATTGVPATTKPGAVTLTALRADAPHTFAAMRYWVGVADLVAHALTGKRATDHTLAVRTMAAGRHGRAWDADVLASVGIAAGMLPELRAPGEPVGLTSGEATRFGIEKGIAVYVAGHDHAVGAWAAGVRRPGDCADSLGTAEAIVRVADSVDTPRAVAAGFAVGLTVDGSAQTVLGGSPACGAMFDWWDAEYPGDEILASLRELDPHGWEPSSAIVLPYPRGRQCPDPDPTARVRMLGDGDRGEWARALLQSLVAHARWMRDTADSLAGSATTNVTVIGSLAGLVPAWGPLVAAAGTHTATCANDEPVASGAALLAAVRAGAASPEASILPLASVTPISRGSFDHTYRRFLSAVTSQGEK